MADFNLDIEGKMPKVAPEVEISSVEEPIIVPEEPVSNHDEAVKGLTMEEISDPNKIKVCIDDDKTPIVILFGPPSSGKTMTLVRLTRYLRQYNYDVTPVKTFRPSVDAHYKRMCDSYSSMVYSDDAASSTSQISFMLLCISKDGHPICQILEAPGEHYYKPKSNEKGFPRYINNILANKTRKIMLYIVEPNWEDSEDRQGYVDRIRALQTKLTRRDKSIFVFNKVDTTSFVRREGEVNVPEAIRMVKNQFKGIFEPFKNDTPILRFFNEYRCAFIPFSTGAYNETIDGGITYEQGSDEYPKKLWNLILKYVRG